MELNYRLLKKIVCLCGMLVVLAVVHIVSVYLFAVHSFSISYDARFSDKTRRDVQEYVQHVQKDGLQCGLFDKQLRQAFACIDSIDCKVRSTGVLQLTIQAVEPLCKLNNDYIVTVCNDIVSNDCYMAESVASLATLHACVENQQTKLPAAMFNFVSTIDPSCFKQASLFWQDTNDIKVVCADAHVHFMCNQSIVLTKELVDRCFMIAQEVIMQSPSVTSVLADVRFADQIIVSKLKS